MNAAKILRFAVIAEIVLILVAIPVSYWADRLLPDEVLALEQNQSNAFAGIDSISFGMRIVLAFGALVALGVWIASITGLLMLKRWGAWLYLITVFLALPAYFIMGFDVLHPIDHVLGDLLRLFPGFIIGLAFFSDAIPKKDNKRIDNDPVESSS